ncbi:hypothetical protein [Antiquaquibacter soli]|uniref:Uncharacterized protein n=1 Tax=Antiquaquibacter soli TaxID=3064523 RepID=A0ABT9BQP9_9MICO|nr:hypothetical protein [Protaetiibacter sp. WY-16]MDO7883350.1 hypothetical protein [Protaetiibacter sp. WY-16]
MTWQLLSVLPVWVLSLAAAVLIGVASAPEQRITWVGIAFAASIVATFVIQLAIQRKEGFVVRTMAGIGGSLVILAATTAVFTVLL